MNNKVELDIIRSVAWKYAKKSPFTFDDLFSEASLAYCKALQAYKADKDVPLLAYLRQSMSYALLDYMKKENRDNNNGLTDTEKLPESIDFTFKEKIDTKFTFESFSKDAKFIFNILKEDTFEGLLDGKEYKDKGFSYFRPPNIKRMVQSLLKEHLSSLKWSKDRINTSFNELKHAAGV